MRSRQRPKIKLPLLVAIYTMVPPAKYGINFVPQETRLGPLCNSGPV